MSRATFDPNDQMILSARVLWDVRMSTATEVHRFEKKGGVFHPYRTEILTNSEVVMIW